MKSLGEMFDVLVGYSDHTPGSIVPLGSVALGACVIEKHFTDDKTRKGPDHSFAMDDNDFKKMVASIRKLEKALGSSKKDIYEEENETVVLQRRCLRASRDITKNSNITEEMINVLRPAPKNSLSPKYKNVILGKRLKSNMKKGEEFTWDKVI
jgi:sialic acid synthase SpsE